LNNGKLNAQLASYHVIVLILKKENTEKKIHFLDGYYLIGLKGTRILNLSPQLG